MEIIFKIYNNLFNKKINLRKIKEIYLQEVTQKKLIYDD